MLFLNIKINQDMRTKIFISNKGTGWKEIEIPEYYKKYSHDALVAVVHKFISNNSYKGILITENPKPFC